jgi:hypothetical protein
MNGVGWKQDCQPAVRSVAGRGGSNLFCFELFISNCNHGAFVILKFTGHKIIVVNLMIAVNLIIDMDRFPLGFNMSTNNIFCDICGKGNEFESNTRNFTSYPINHNVNLYYSSFPIRDDQLFCLLFPNEP